MSITTAQIRGARGLLNWSQSELSERTGISGTSIGAIENGTTQPRESTLNAIQKSFEDAGIEFIGSEGIRKKSLHVDILKDTEGFKKFSKQVHEAVQTDNREVLQAYVDDSKFAEWLGDEAVSHVEVIQSSPNKKFKILQKEGDAYFPAKSYAEYRWIPEEQFLAVPFMVFGDKFAIILYEPDPTIIVMNYPVLAEAYRLQFSIIWEQAIQPPADLISNWEVPEKYKKLLSTK